MAATVTPVRRAHTHTHTHTPDAEHKAAGATAWLYHPGLQLLRAQGLRFGARRPRTSTHSCDASSSADRPSVKSAGGPERPAAAAVTVSERPQPGQRSGSAAEAATAKEARNVALVAQLQSIRSGKVDGRSMSSSLVALPSGAARSAADTAALQAKLEAVRFRIEVPLVPGT